MNIGLIALDLDGTLMLPDHLTVSVRNKETLKKAHDMGVKIAISTGRTLSVIERVIEQIPFIDYVMYSDGAAVYDVNKKKIIYEKLIDFDITKQVIEYLNGVEVYYNLYLDGKIVTQNGRQRFFKNSDLPQKFVDDYIKNTTVYDDLLFSIKGRGAELIVGFFNCEEDLNNAFEYVNRYNDKLYVTSAFTNEFEMTNIEATKGKTMDYLCSLEGITSENVMAIGDSHNDLPMLDFAGISVAMGNAEQKVKENADFVTETNANDGVAYAIEKYVLNY